MPASVRVLGVDPGLTRCGVGVVDVERRTPTLVHVEVLRSDADEAIELRLLRIARGVAYIDLRDLRRIIPNASTSCGSALLLAQLNRTARQFPAVRRTVYSFDGDVGAFYEWLQLSPP